MPIPMDHVRTPGPWGPPSTPRQMASPVPASWTRVGHSDIFPSQLDPVARGTMPILGRHHLSWSPARSDILLSSGTQPQGLLQPGHAPRSSAPRAPPRLPPGSRLCHPFTPTSTFKLARQLCPPAASPPRTPPRPRHTRPPTRPPATCVPTAPARMFSKALSPPSLAAQSWFAVCLPSRGRALGPGPPATDFPQLPRSLFWMAQEPGVLSQSSNGRGWLE